jgi:hypothetical protein
MFLNTQLISYGLVFAGIMPSFMIIVKACFLLRIVQPGGKMRATFTMRSWV